MPSSAHASCVEAGWTVSPSRPTPFTNANGVYQDGLLCFARDSGGTLWSLLGHMGLGDITLWRGRSVDDLTMLGPVRYNFPLLQAGPAFNGVPYPDGPRSRGQVWPCALWIDPADDTFYCYVHNETGWGGGPTSYNVYGYHEGEPDFRHIGLMSSSDRGRSWDFRGWIITSDKPCWSTLFQPDGMTGGQPPEGIVLGAGDHSLFVNDADGYLYIFYTENSTVYVARAPKSSLGLPGSWQKYYEGAFCEPGNMGRATPLLTNAVIPGVLHNTHLGKYLMTTYHPQLWRSGQGACQIALSDDLVHWSAPRPLDPSRTDLSRPYWTPVSAAESGSPNVAGRTFRLFYEGNGTDVWQVDVTVA